MAIMCDRLYSLDSIARVSIDTETQPLSLTESQVKITEKSLKTDLSEDKKWYYLLSSLIP
ncbi:hypothetical protein Cylst_4834 [Cylindrospermum stagnale PCC 7417]|uniref:Uncharacterized protein n=1 Tax=Cylindrospermum stagnale PCC 7417 TaxID=56107 RepID=K9X2L9_9NOST|nr:hypothetical protein [Cylindrospermum stagnale]AFZ26890.1 hypothetical protein Cylst_4834 [Cylindrospermum stagnale PCC 7417]